MKAHGPKTLTYLANTASTPKIGFDPSKYAHHVAGLDLTDAQRDELIQTVANIMIAFVDLGFGVSTSQTACGEEDILSSLIPETSADLLHSDHPENSPMPERLPFDAHVGSEES